MFSICRPLSIFKITSTVVVIFSIAGCALFAGGYYAYDILRIDATDGLQTEEIEAYNNIPFDHTLYRRKVFLRVYAHQNFDIGTLLIPRNTRLLYLKQEIIVHILGPGRTILRSMQFNDFQVNLRNIHSLNLSLQMR